MTNMQKTIAFDEAGNTGQDLLQCEQPVFALASVCLEVDVAAQLAAFRGNELHFKSARRSEHGRRAILRVLSDPSLSQETVRAVVAHKPFTLVAKMVDLLVEPIAAANGHDLYAMGEHVARSNLLFATLPMTLGVEQARLLYEGFAQMCRQPTLRRRAAFIELLRTLAAGTDTQTAEHLKLFALGAARGEFGDGDVPDLDPAPPCLMALAHSWAADGEPFEILHDDRRELRRWAPHLAAFWPASSTPQTFVLYDGRTVTYPLPVTDLRVAPSHSDPRLQLADVVAGGLQFVLSSKLGSSPDPVFAARLAETPLLTWVTDDGYIWPSLDIGPDDLGVKPGATHSLADAITAWAMQR